MNQVPLSQHSLVQIRSRNDRLGVETPGERRGSGHRRRCSETHSQCGRRGPRHAAGVPEGKGEGKGKGIAKRRRATAMGVVPEKQRRNTVRNLLYIWSRPRFEGGILRMALVLVHCVQATETSSWGQLGPWARLRTRTSRRQTEPQRDRGHAAMHCLDGALRLAVGWLINWTDRNRRLYLERTGR